MMMVILQQSFECSESQIWETQPSITVGSWSPTVGPLQTCFNAFSILSQQSAIQSRTLMSSPAGGICSVPALARMPQMHNRLDETVNAALLSLYNQWMRVQSSPCVWLVVGTRPRSTNGYPAFSRTILFWVGSPRCFALRRHQRSCSTWPTQSQHTNTGQRWTRTQKKNLRNLCRSGHRESKGWTNAMTESMLIMQEG